MDPEEREEVLTRASSALRDGACVVLPTDTLYGLFTSAAPQGVALLDELTGSPDPDYRPRMTLHLSDAGPVKEHLDLRSAVARRLVDRLLPGAARLVIEQPESAIGALCGALGVDRGVVDHEGWIALRVPDHPITRRVIRESGVACVARRLGGATWAQGEDPGTDTSALPSDPDPAPAVVVDDGKTLHQTGSTTVRIGLDGKLVVASGGAMSERDVMAHLERTVLFVCSGNTCRSPMAEGIARKLIDESAPDGITTRVLSAGIAAADGAPPAGHAVSVMNAMGIDISSHRSRLLTLDLIDRAELIYTMTASHAQGVMTMAPNSVHKVFPLDPTEGVPDPIGQDEPVYAQTAQRLRSMIERRLEEIRV